MPESPNVFIGLNNEEVIQSRLLNGANTIQNKKEKIIWYKIIEVVKEPMILILLTAAAIYFISGNIGDAIFLLLALLFTVAISIFQDNRSKNALAKLQEYTQPKCKVIRNSTTQLIDTNELVVGDILIVEEGNIINADGFILQSNDFTVSESILTGESLPVSKNTITKNEGVFKGTTVVSGLAIVQVTATGNASALGKIGKSIESIDREKTPLEIQISGFVKKMVAIGFIVFLFVLVLNYIRTYNFLDSLLKALTLAMSIIPEEIPVAFTTFMALGAWRLMNLGVVVKQMKTVETLGSATIICTDKTGTITENKMSLAGLYTLNTNTINITGIPKTAEEKELIKIATFASEPIPFDPMEVALHDLYTSTFEVDERKVFNMIHEYPLGGTPPMMTHIFGNANHERIIAAKGAPEAFMTISDLTVEDIKLVQQNINSLAAKGYRILGVAEGIIDDNNYPEKQQFIKFNFKGLVAFYDPPKANIQSVLERFYTAGIQVKIVTGDNAETTKSLAQQVHLKGYENCLSGKELMQLSTNELEKAVAKNYIFSRMFPDAKLKIIEALKRNKEIVAMTGDGVNDGPALQSAHIGIAMGKKGSEIAKQAASLILVNDDFAKMVDAIAMGRKIYSNLKKAIQYIISIHIPIILTVFIPLALGWIYPNIFTPVHVIFLELIMGPTCSIIYENEPIEANAMLQKPRPFSSTFFNFKELMTSIVQGLIITAGTLFTYQYAVKGGMNENVTRTMVFTTLISANIWLTLVNRSFYYSFITTLHYKNNLVPFIIVLTIAITASLIYIPAFSSFFLFESLSVPQLLFSILIGCIAVLWYECIKLIKRTAKPN